jgi:hypothetical protein
MVIHHCATVSQGVDGMVASTSVRIGCDHEIRADREFGEVPGCAQIGIGVKTAHPADGDEADAEALGCGHGFLLEPALAIIIRGVLS